MRALTAVVATLGLLVGGLVSAPAALAADGALTIDKTVNGVESVTLAPGAEFTYQITVGCDDNDCLDATFTDTLPTEFDGFQILSSAVTPSAQPSSSAWTGCTVPGLATTSCTLNVAFLQPVDGGVGLNAGDQYQITITLRVPQNLPATWPGNNVPLTNTASATATNAAPVSDGAVVTVSVPISVDTSVGKTWAPASQQYSPGAASTITLTSANTSNVFATSLTVQDPTDAAEGAAALAASNPFTLVDFTGFGSPAALPAGADQVQVDAYVLQNGVYTWVTGSPGAAPALPGGVAAADVAGLRFVVTSTTGETIDPGGAAGSLPILVEQRSTNRQTGAALSSGASLTNSVTGTIEVAGQPPVSKTATAPYAITPITVAVTAAKSINPARIPAGIAAEATITGTNTSNAPVTSLRIADLDYFTNELLFAGFTSPLSYPAGATAGTITWYYSDGSTIDAAVATGATPTAPAAPAGAYLTGFELVFTGSMPTGSAANAQFDILPVPTFADAAPNETRAVSNRLDVSATNPIGTAEAVATAPLAVFVPDIELTVDKSIRPGGAVSPGATVVAQLPTSTSSDSAFVNPTSIVIEDAWNPAEGTDEFFNAFNPIALAPTQVPPNTVLTVKYQTSPGGPWIDLTTFPSQSGARFVQYTIPSALVPTITGLQYTFDNAAGFAQGVTVTPNTVFQARADLRDGSGPTSVPDQPATVYQNTATAQGTGEVPAGPSWPAIPVTSDVVQDTAPAQIVTNTGIGTLLGSKNWSDDVLVSQSGQRSDTVLGWGVTSTGYSQVVVSDPNGGENTPQSTTFQAFDLQRIGSVSYTVDPLLRWDTIASVQLYNGTSWQALPAPGGSWMDGDGFKGYTLSTAQRASTTGVRYIMEPNDAARAASTDPLAPPVGSGVATSPTDTPRTLRLYWDLRNVVRVPASATDRWATEDFLFNDTAPGAIVNTVGISGTQDGTVIGPRQAQDVISLIDAVPGVGVAKTTQRPTIVIPEPGDVDPSGYPINRFTITAQNDSASRASYVRVTDPMPCSAVPDCVSPADAWDADPYASATYDPITNPFERFTLTNIDVDVPAGQVDQSASTVTLWSRADDGTLSTSTLSLAAAQALTAPALVDVVGVSVVYQGASPETTGGTIQPRQPLRLLLDTQLRVNLRSQPATPVTTIGVDNDAFAQSYDPVLAPSGPDSRPFASRQAEVQLLEGKLGVEATKVFRPDRILEARRADPITMTIGANQGDQTVATNEVTVEDTDQDFWNTFALQAYTPSSVVFPAGANRVDVGFQVNGDPTWYTTGPQVTAGTPPLPPGADLADVTGVRFVFTRVGAGGAPQLFSRTAPPQAWTTTIPLRVVLRGADGVTGDPIPFPGSVDNEVSARSHRFDGVYADATAVADDAVTLDPGTFRLDVAKDPQGGTHTVPPGEPNTWTISFANTGTGFLTIDSLVDSLPTSLEWDGDAPVYSTSSGGTLSTDVQLAQGPAAGQLTLTWPEGGQRMSPGERFTIRIGIVLQPGLRPSDRATNLFQVNTGQTLAACTNTSGNGEGTLPGLPATACGSSNYVQPRAGASLLTTKAVKGDVVDPVDPANPLVSGGRNLTAPGATCVPDAAGYYRSPCVANTVVGGVDEWKISATNSGTDGYRQLTLVDALPFPGDRLLATGASRGSVYTPRFTGIADVRFTGIPVGATPRVQITVAPAAQVCVGTGPTAWPADPKCDAHPAGGWVNAANYTGDWAAVTGIRAIIDFTARNDAHALELSPGESVTMYFRTVNTPATVVTGGAPVTVPVSNTAVAWNQHGAVADLVNGPRPFARAPVKAGVVLATGSLQVTKAITGAGSAYAPDSFTADVSCTVAGGAPVDMGAFGTVTLTTANSFTQRIDGIPLGSTCSVTETGADGSFGETTRSVTPTSVLVRTAGGAGTPVPADQQVTVTNDYALTSLVVTKDVVTEATVGEFGPFDFEASCTTALGTPIVLDPADAAFTLADGESHTIADLPARAECSVDEVGSDSASGVAWTANGVAGDGTGAGIVLVPGANTLAFANQYAAGTLAVAKTVDGAGGADYGSGPFTVHVTCTYGTQTLFDGDIELLGGETETLEPVFPVDTQCSVVETGTGGANQTDVDQPTVVITGPAAGQTVGAVTVAIMNTFLVGSLDIVKERTGDGASLFGAGPFTAQATCTYLKDGVTFTALLPGGGIVALSEANGYEASIGGILVGAECVVVETDAGLAQATTLTPADGTVTIVEDGDPAGPVTVTITNRFDIGELAIAKTVDAPIATVGDVLSYTISLTNPGQIDATGVVVTDQLPAGLELVSTSPQASVSGRTLTWTVDIAVGQTLNFTVTARALDTGDVVNSATFVPPGGSFLVPPAGETATASTQVRPSLPATGAAGPWGLAAGSGLLVVLAGLVLVVISRRRRTV